MLGFEQLGPWQWRIYGEGGCLRLPPSPPKKKIKKSSKHNGRK